MNINKIITIIWILIILFLWWNYYLKDLNTQPDIWWFFPNKEEIKLINKLNNKNIQIIKFDLKKYNIKKNSYNNIYNYFSSFSNSSIINIDKDWIISFALSKKLNNKDKERITKKIKNLIKDKKFEKKDYLILIHYNIDLVKKLLNKNIDSKIFEDKKVFEKKEFKDKKITLKIPENKINKYFNNNNFIIDKEYITDKLVDSIFIWFWWKLYPKLSLLKLKFLWKIYKQGYDITKTSFPIIAIYKEKKQWDWILVTKFNNKKKQEIFRIYNNIYKYISTPNKITEITDNKWFAKQYQNVYQFTDFDQKKYFKLYLEWKNYKILKEKNNTLLLETKNNYIILYFDKYNKSNINIEDLPRTWYIYKFQELEEIITNPILDSKTFINNNKILKENNLPPLNWTKINIIGKFLTL